MTEQELKEIEERAKKATPGPWEQWAGWGTWSKNNDSLFPDEIHWPVTSVEVIKLPGWKGYPSKFTEVIARVHTLHDQKFITHARADVPRLCAELRSAREEIKNIHDEWKEEKRIVVQMANEENVQLQEKIVQKEEEIASLKIHNDRLSRIKENYCDEIDSENVRLRKALKFYADQKSYHRKVGPDEERWIDIDEGQLARATLKGK